MRVAALIPARANSHRVIRKNWSIIGGLPMWRHAINHAREGGCHLVAITSDDKDILASKAADMMIVQPQFRQTYDVMMQVVRHADGELHDSGHEYDAICLLQPTSPLRTPHDVASCIEALATLSVDAVVSVTQGPDDIAFQIRHAGRLEKLPPIVVPNGAIYAIKTSVLRAGGHWYGDYTYAYVMPKERSIDVDNELDLEMARLAWDHLYERSGG